MIKQYESYKPIKSSVYKEAPITWKKYRVKDTVDKNTYYPVGDGDHGSIKPEMYQEDGIPYIRVQNLTWHGEILTDGIVCISEEVQLENKKSKLYPGDILIAKTGATIGKLGLITESIKEANTTSSVGKLTVDKKRFSPKYILYCFQSRALQDQIWLEASQKSAQPGFNIDDLIVFEFLAPDLDGQLRVVEYLDHQTAIIDQLIQQKEKLIELLKEKRQAVINETVTKGLNPNAKMTESKIEWLGKVPEHWKISKLKHLVDMKSGNFISAEMIEDEGLYPVYGGNGLRGYHTEYTHEGFFPLIGRQGALCGNINYAEGKFWPTEHAVVVSPKKQINTYWIGELLRIMNLNQYSQASAQPGLSVEKIINLRIPFPPFEEQTKIALKLKSMNEKFEFMIFELIESISKLKEYRQSLISEAVTGKIDVRDWQPNKKQVA